jgi:hypothetical protein
MQKKEEEKKNNNFPSTCGASADVVGGDAEMPFGDTDAWRGALLPLVLSFLKVACQKCHWHER